MPSLVFLAAVLSCDVTRVLVSNGYGLGYDTDAAAGSTSGVGRFTGATNPATGLPYAPLAITNCTGNGVPIVVTTQYPHGVSTRGIGGMACIVSGVGGNTNANNVSTEPNDRTVGLNQGALAVPVPGQPRQLALYGQDQDRTSATVGKLIPLVGNGAWTGGGTIVPALTDGQILLNRPSLKEQSAPPRIVLVPRLVAPGPDDMSLPFAGRTSELYAQKLQRALGSDGVQFDVHCWGQRLPTPDAAYDVDVTFALAQSVKASCYLLFGQAAQWGGGTWDDEKERATQEIKAGKLFTFSLTIDVPILDTALSFIPGSATFESVIQSTTPETEQVIDQPIG